MYAIIFLMMLQKYEKLYNYTTLRERFLINCVWIDINKTVPFKKNQGKFEFPLIAVRLIGLEPTRREAPDPKSGVSTNFTTGAEDECKDRKFSLPFQIICSENLLPPQSLCPYCEEHRR